MLFSVVFDVIFQSLCLLTGLSGNSFILIVYILDWLRTHGHNPCNLILNGIAISLIFLQGIIFFQEVGSTQFLDFYSQESTIITAFVALTSFSLSSLYCSTCLCFYYCVKIVQFHGTLFYKLKAKLPVMVPWLLAFSVVLSWSVAIPSYWDFYTNISFTTDNSTGNITIVMLPEYKSKCGCIFLIYSLFASLAFTIILLTTGAIITSLCQHMRRMRQNNDNEHSRIRTHLSAARTMISLLVVYLLFYTAFTLEYNTTELSEDIFTVCFTIITMLPTIISVILILGNRNLTNFLKQLLCMQLSVGNTEVTVTTNL